MLDLEPHRGHSAADVLEGRGATLQVIDGGLVQVGDSSLHVATRRGGGQVTIGEQEWTELFNLAYSHYDLVLVDAPPLSRSLLGVFAAPSAQATLAVVAAEETRASVALNLIERIGGAGGRVLAVVLNKRRYYIPKQIYQRL
jgi:hypothetical protein